MPNVQTHLSNAADNIVNVASTPIAVASTAAASILSPWWFPAAKEFADGAALLLPVLGCVLAALQIAAMIAKFLKR